MISTLCLCSCSMQQNSDYQDFQLNTSKMLVLDEPNISSKIESKTLLGNEQIYLSFPIEEQEFLENYFNLWREAIIGLSEHELTPYNYKSDSLTSSINQMSNLFDKYGTNKEKLGCLIDFYVIAGSDATYQLDYLQSTLNVASGESNFIFDDTYDRYVYDLAQIYNNLGETYFPDDFKNN